MSFFNEAMDFMGSVSRYINQQGLQQTAVAQPVVTTQANVPISKDDFMNMLKEALAEYKSELGSEDDSTEVTSSSKKPDVKELFDYLDSNKDGNLSDDEFKRLDYLFEVMKMQP